MKEICHNLIKLCALAVIIPGTTSTLLAGGFSLPDQDAFATARGEAFVATADNPSAIFYNPAGITQLDGNNLRGGAYGIILSPTFTSPTTGNTFDNETKLHAVPQVFYTYGRTNWPVSFGFGAYSPFGLGMEWPDNTGFRTVTGGLSSSILYMTFNPVMAVKLPYHFSFAAGVSANYVYADLKQGLLPTLDNNYFEFKGTGWGVAYNLGLLWQPIEQLSFGATFRSSDTIYLKGHTQAGVSGLNGKSDASGNFNFPLETVFGVSYRPTPVWNLEVDGEYLDWSTLQTVNIHQSTPSPIVPLSNVPVVLDWQSSWFAELGATRYFNPWHVSAGFIFNENSVPDAHYTPSVADMNKYFGSIGAGYKGKRFNFDVAYQFGYGTREVTGSMASLAGQTANGKYRFLSNALIVSAGLHF